MDINELILVGIVVGDTEGSGHGVTATEWFVCNYSLDQIKEAYNTTVDSLKVDLLLECDDDEEPTLSKSFFKVLVKAGIDATTSNELTPTEFAITYLQMAKYSRPSLTWEHINKSDLVEIRGYGLLYS